MFYAFSHTVTALNTETNPHELEMPLSAGVVHQVDILFQDGCNHKVFVKIFEGGHQLWPTNRKEKFRGNATVVSYREFHELEPGNNKLTAKIWTTLEEDFVEIIIQIGVLPKAILQPLSFDELLKAMQGI